MPARLEHANITVPDIEAAIDFLRSIDPGFVVLHDSGDGGDRRWVHIGSADGYIALERPHSPPDTPITRRNHTDIGINHIGLVVGDVDAAAERLLQRGYRESYRAERHPARIRRYFHDTAGLEWELVQYLTDDPVERFHYA